MPEIVWQILTGLIIATASAWITVQLSLRRFRTERWWERKVESYKNVIEALHNSMAFASDFFQAEAEGRKIPEERDKELQSRARKAKDEILKATDVGAFILSEKALTRLKKYKDEADEASQSDNWYDYLYVELEATEKCLKDFIEIAKKDLKTR